MEVSSVSLKFDQKYPEGNTKPLGTNSRSRHWCFTSFADDEPSFKPSMKYLLYSPELCPTSGRKHWQGYCYYFDKKSMSASQKQLGGKHHHCIPLGDLDDQKSYIIGPYDKQGKVKPYNPDYKVFGNEPSQGQRTDLDELKNNILSGDTNIDAILVEHPGMYHMYGRTLDKLEDLRMSKVFRSEMTECEWLWGPTGTGKSHRAFAGYSPESHYVLPNDNGWWDSYKQQEVVIINDFRGWIPYNELLQLIDKWVFNVRRRGRAPLPFTSRKVIITSSLHPAVVYNNRNSEDSIEQLLRRISVIRLETVLK
ncbi:hypothetical protein [uncultured marine virus]|uniref:ATP-dependent helicase Rep n=1 Tax=uncultured marine virus TaxID=186617 RepID=S4TFC1_9VIRU|nr:hypothetical protein [uncultured marine virus]